MTAARSPVTVAPLVELLTDLAALQDELGAVLRSKLEAVRRADVAAMHSAEARAGLLAERILQLDRRRREVVGQVVAALGWPRDRAPVISQIAGELAEPQRSRLLVLARGLRQKMLAVAEANRVLALVAGEMLGHYRTLFTAMTRTDEDGGTYSSRGRSAGRGAVRVLDAVG